MKKKELLRIIESLTLLVILITFFLSDYSYIQNEHYMLLILFGVFMLILSLIKDTKDEIKIDELMSCKKDMELKEYDMMREHLEQEIVLLQGKLINSAEDWENIYHLPLSAQKKAYNNGPIQYINFIKKFGLDETDVSIDKKMVFLLTPFSNEATGIYISIKSICAECGLNLYRGDEEFSHEDILSNIVRYIVKSRIIIANIDGKNPNVFYELGIAQTLGKPTILVSNSIEEVPFDLQHNRIVIYKDKDDLKIKLSKQISLILVDY